MKLEELSPLTMKIQPTQDEDEDFGKAESSKAATNELAEGEIAEDAVEENNTEKESATGGKKKGTRKKRSLNWEEAERGLLLEVIKPKVEFVENRSVDAKSIKSKRTAWTHITKQFNALNFRHRLLEQIQVQWRSMKNFAKREYQLKHSKNDHLDGIRMIEFMEEMQKEPVLSRSQTRSAGGSSSIKKELMELDEDEDMPLAALPNSTNGSDDTLQTSTIAIPSPPPSTAGNDSQHETCQQSTPPRNRKRAKQVNNKTTTSKEDAAAIETVIQPRGRKRQRQRKVSSQTQVTSDDAINEVSPKLQLSSAAATVTCADLSNCSDLENKYKLELFKIIKQARLAEMDFVRREHEQKLRFEQMERELRMRNMREEHDMRLRHHQAEHEARLKAFSLREFSVSRVADNFNNDNGVSPISNLRIGGATTSNFGGHNNIIN